MKNDPQKHGNASKVPAVFFIDQSGELGGAELSLLDIVKNNKGNRKVCILGEGPLLGILSNAQIPHVLITMPQKAAISRFAGPLTILQAVPSVFELLKKIGTAAKPFDVVYANTMKAFVFSALSSPWHKRPIIWHLRDILSPEHSSKILRFFAVMLANLTVKRVIANSSATANSFVTSGGKSNPLVIYNGIPSEPLLSIDPSLARENLVRETGFDSSKPIAGIFSRLAQWKGQHVVVEALKEVPDMQLVIVGGALFGEDAYAEKLYEQIKTSGLSHRVTCLGFRNDIPNLIRGVDIVVHASVAPEPFGRVLVEGMLADKPVIATIGGGVTEVIEHDKTGILVNPGVVSELAAAMNRLVKNPTEAKAIARSGQDDALSRFSPVICTTKINAAVEEVFLENA